MVGVVVDDAHACGETAFLEAPPRPPVPGETGSRPFDVGAEAVGDRDRSRGVAGVVGSGLAQRHRQRCAASGHEERELRAEAGDEVGDPDVGVLGGAVEEDCRPGLARMFGDVPGAGVVGAGDDRAAAPADPVAEVDEGLPDVLRGPVVVEVVGFDVGEDADRGLVEEEGAVGLVRLGDEDVPGAEVGVRSRRREHPADDERGVESAGLERDRRHRRRRRLPVGARHGHGPRVGHERGERPGAVEDPQPPRARGDEFRVVLADRRGDDEGVGLAEVVGGVADLDAGAERPEDVDDGGLLRVRSRHAHPVHRHDPGDPGHARASDADEVDGSEFGDGDDLSCAHGQPLRAEVVIWAIVAAASVG
ncbi:Uncharacterised protein [Mycobacteroides abscessus subsp. abscessus]|nr:Uncharacterised protein [Mycobacteroides abscessus subsp. abscessus]